MGYGLRHPSMHSTSPFIIPVYDALWVIFADKIVYKQEEVIVYIWSYSKLYTFLRNIFLTNACLIFILHMLVFPKKIQLTSIMEE